MHSPISQKSAASSVDNTPSLARSNSTSSSVYSMESEPSSIEQDAAPPHVSVQMEQKRKQQQELIIATSDYYDYALKLERLRKERSQTERDKVVLKRNEKRSKLQSKQSAMRLIDFGPENSRLIGHTQATLDSKLQFTEDEVKRVKMHMKRIREQYPQVEESAAAPIKAPFSMY